MSALHIARLFLLIAIMSTVVSTYAVLPSGEILFRRPASLFDRAADYSDDVAKFDESRDKRELDGIDTQLSKRTNLKRLVILSARGFGKK
ncbi:Neuropeptide-Like Protein [Caenorhabditis elegans]|uniref:Neuropeptide-Like Protein n=1 Tax=Caenorhabditis elegans TaxID=6239 RepID=Q7YX51_CAEEL|nr:Neuropeptide-Like Protein [Caenorhabditis elegans]CAE17758.1 Neuropeptide-Like Protein [Caenorhabditis elegans]|eukprot:NP_001023763.1 Neuropeptide-Like Protein [Caenorhabditis elegans]